MNKAEQTAARLKSIISIDQYACLDTLIKIAKSDLIAVLSDYMTLDRESVTLQIQVTDQGEFDIRLQAKAKNLLAYGKTV